MPEPEITWKKGTGGRLVKVEEVETDYTVGHIKDLIQHHAQGLAQAKALLKKAQDLNVEGS